MCPLKAQQQKKVLNSFRRVVDMRNSRFISEELYNHLNLNCNFSSHFSLEAFRDAYEGDHIQEFLKRFDRRSPKSQWLEAPKISTEFADLNRGLIDYASSRSHDLNQ
ncbi:Hypothetical protein DEACI_4151 [Acididesulfobacillus acetoxydans]|uniref:Uncharacterized protein n=1 Tax=Acididesulfobacillus acetoxydans TaxID=1561005 RepID=A0A8S0W5N4_9FIRM|nr:hypothetical protein [Acididesulfobacillus acetoxydans]CAA7603328.1 Hypothetical protein DEACI_4151 [Acididesulfobacillus acetoxydans]CEJ09671.1 Hypothetical protein DEACI_4156 [Acididesulfobacillus acetoxydans]